MLVLQFAGMLAGAIDQCGTVGGWFCYLGDDNGYRRRTQVKKRPKTRNSDRELLYRLYIATNGRYVQLSVSPDKWSILLLEVRNVLIWRLTTCHSVRIGGYGSDLKLMQLEAAYRACIGS